MLISRIVTTGDIAGVLRWGITSDDFQTMEGRALFQHILGYAQTAQTSGAIIGPNTLRQMFPTFQLVDDPAMTTEALCHELRLSHCRALTRHTMMQVENLLDGNYGQALNQLSGAVDYLRRLQGGKATDVFADEAGVRILYNHDLRASGVDMSVCPWPWEPLQEATMGIVNDDYIVIYGRPKSFKSWVLSYLIAWCFMKGKRVLLYTKEMTADNIIQRVMACMSEIDYKSLRLGKMSQMDRQRFQQTLDWLRWRRMEQPMVALSGKDVGEGGDTVPWLKSKIEEHKPDIAFIDGMYLMANSRGNGREKDNYRVQQISRDLRQTILETKVPLICTLQANRDAAKNKEANLDEIAFSDAIGQDATLAMRVINEKNAPTLALMIGGSREFSLEGFRIFGQPAQCFSYAGPITTAELIEAQKSDIPQGTGKGRGRKSGTGGGGAGSDIDAAVAGIL